ncbi:unnamed protein product [Didymodactylos carnosus]|uniref:Uncharacterized protein n=1 Tax=Didymodactylos carnosus TaxID=1234261 RepID=A0A8S2G1B7_9BILA|nr:unnamed protein product [Didymodactylos carnosus]CAF4380819.1 unnamed protein product [Didymodactylos carnosus]CAF4645439.1 unnamed protein product [Didymodactylos carnosus]
MGWKYLTWPDDGSFRTSLADQTWDLSGSARPTLELLWPSPAQPRFKVSDSRLDFFLASQRFAGYVV